MSSKEGTQNVEPLEIPKVALEVGKGFSSAIDSLSLREGMADKPRFDSIKVLTTMAGILFLLVEDMAILCICTKVALF